MAISIVNVTHSDASVVSPTVLHTVSIPATSIGNTLIVLATTHSNGAVPDSVADDNFDFFAYTEIVGARNQSHPSFFQAVAMFYRTGIEAGLTNIYVHYGGTLSATSHVVVLEVAGINTAAPVETSNTKTTTATTSNPVGNATTTAFTNALFVGAATSTSSTMNTLNNSWTRGNTDIADHKMGYFIGSGTSTMSISNTGSSNQNYLVSTAVFNPTANVLTLDLSEGITTDDSLSDVADFNKELDETISLMDTVMASLSSLTYFKTLLETITLGITISFMASFIRFLQDEFTMADSISFVHNIFRTKTDTITVRDWLSVKKISSDWGS